VCITTGLVCNHAFQCLRSKVSAILKWASLLRIQCSCIQRCCPSVASLSRTSCKEVVEISLPMLKTSELDGLSELCDVTCFSIDLKADHLVFVLAVDFSVLCHRHFVGECKNSYFNSPERFLILGFWRSLWSNRLQKQLLTYWLRRAIVKGIMSLTEDNDGRWRKDESRPLVRVRVLCFLRCHDTIVWETGMASGL